MLILHNPLDAASRDFVAAHPGHTVIAWYTDSLSPVERAAADAGKAAFLDMGYPSPSSFPSVCLDLPAASGAVVGANGADEAIDTVPEAKTYRLDELPVAAWTIAKVYALAGVPLPDGLRAIWPAGVPLPEEIVIS